MTADYEDGHFLSFPPLTYTDGSAAIDKLSNIQGVTRILTRSVPIIQHEIAAENTFPSGHHKSVIDSIFAGSLEKILEYAERSAREQNRRTVPFLIGSGINTVTLCTVLSHLRHGAQEIHLTGGRWVEGGMWHRPEGMGMGVSGNEWSVWRTSEEAIREVKIQTDEFNMK
jgi:copper homeostasis protein